MNFLLGIIVISEYHRLKYGIIMNKVRQQMISENQRNFARKYRR